MHSARSRQPHLNPPLPAPTHPAHRFAIGPRATVDGSLYMGRTVDFVSRRLPSPSVAAAALLLPQPPLLLPRSSAEERAPVAPAYC